MRLTGVLFRRNWLPNGHIFRGKDRLVRRVEPQHVRVLRYNYGIEESNMLLLRHPYLTEEQSSGHALALGKHEAYQKRIITATKSKFKDDVTIGDRLVHLKTTDNWE